VGTQVEVVVVRHEREAWKSTGTARIALHALKNSQLVEYRDDGMVCNEILSELLTGTALLFPDADEGKTFAEAPSTVSRLLVLDGTWRQTRRMLKRLPVLSSVPRIMLGEKALAPLRLRDSDDPCGRSTLEAIADALDQLQEPTASAQLHALHTLYVERVFRARGVWNQKSNPNSNQNVLP
jgi:DTW domain-containing protein YfiP